MNPERAEEPAEVEKGRMLFFRSGGESFILGIESVEEIVVDRDWTPVPLSPPSVMGVVNHRGKIYTIVNFARLAGIDGGGEERTAVFLHRQDMTVGIAVSSIDGIEWVPRPLLEGNGASADEGKEAFLKGILDFGGRVVSVVDSARLADTIARLTDVAGETDARGE